MGLMVSLGQTKKFTLNRNFWETEFVKNNINRVFQLPSPILFLLVHKLKLQSPNRYFCILPSIKWKVTPKQSFSTLFESVFPATNPLSIFNQIEQNKSLIYSEFCLPYTGSRNRLIW